MMACWRLLKLPKRAQCTRSACARQGCFTVTFGILMAFCVVMTSLDTHMTPIILRELDEKMFNSSGLGKNETVTNMLVEQTDSETLKWNQSTKPSKIVQHNRSTINYTTSVPQELRNATLTLYTKVNNTNKTEVNGIPIRTHITRYPVTAFNNPYVLNSKNVCADLKSLTFLVIVHTATNHFQRRASMRGTWANYTIFQNHTIRIVFLLGKPTNEATQRLIVDEHKQYKDIVQGDFIDSYRNLTNKGVLGFRWITENCQQAKFILKVDDDVFVNVFKLLNRIESIYKNKANCIWCSVRHKGRSRIQRYTGKWKIESYIFQNRTTYPVTYCNGFFTLLTSDMIPQLYEAAKTTPFFWVDDVYLFGLLPDKVGGIKFLSMQNLSLDQGHAETCFTSEDRPCQLLMGSARSNGVMEKLWSSVLDKQQTLARKYLKSSLFTKT